jgi:hypothetical protein
MKVLIIVLLLAFSSFSQAAKLVILTDQKGGAAANAMADLIKKTAPFSRLQNFKINIVEVSSIPCKPKQVTVVERANGKKLPASCESQESQKAANERLKRGVSCDSYSELASLQAENNADFMLVVRDNPTHGGTARGNLAILNSGSALNTGLHELLHMMGVADEYKFSTTCETDIKCDLMKTVQLKSNGFSSTPHESSNVTIFADNPPYVSDAEARELHSGMIPWYSQILPRTLITTGTNLGTPQKGVIGLFPSNTCKLASDKIIKSWKSGSEVTVMESSNTNFIPRSSWPAIAAAVGERILSQPVGEEVIYKRISKDGKYIDQFEQVSVPSGSSVPKKPESSQVTQ